MTGARNDQHAEAHRLVDELAANGAAFTFKPALGAMPASFHYQLNERGDRQRCRRIISAAKADPATWCALVAEIGHRCNGGAS